MTQAARHTSSNGPGRAGTGDEPPFRLMGGTFTMMVLRLNRPDDPAFFPQLLDKIEQAPEFFRHAPVVLDIATLAPDRPFNFAEFGRRLRQHQLVPVGVQNGSDEHRRMATAAGYSLVPAGRQTGGGRGRMPSDAESEGQGRQAASDRQAASPAPDAGTPTRLIAEPVRSGRQIYAHAGDLVALSSISSGAEILADGHVHIYGSLRGRALAGVTGDSTARIFCQAFDPELVSIAGYWRVREDIDEALIGKPVQCRLEGEALVMTRLDRQ